MNDTFEQSLNRLTVIVEALDDSETGLDESIALYKEGLTLAKSCGEALNRYEADILVLQKESEAVFTTSAFDAL